jgi:hypothetical protein
MPVPTVFMGGNHGNLGSHGGMSPLTYRGSGLMGGGASVAGLRSLGGAARAHPTPDIKSTSTTRSSDPVVVPLVQPNISSAISILEDSSLDPSIPSPSIPAPSPTPILMIKDKVSDLGLKDIIDKDSWIDAQKILTPTCATLPTALVLTQRPSSPPKTTKLLVPGGKRSSTSMSNPLFPTCSWRSLNSMEKALR